jgi:hypothetical protein
LADPVARVAFLHIPKSAGIFDSIGPEKSKFRLKSCLAASQDFDGMQDVVRIV